MDWLLGAVVVFGKKLTSFLNTNSSNNLPKTTPTYYTPFMDYNQPSPLEPEPVTYQGYFNTLLANSNNPVKKQATMSALSLLTPEEANKYIRNNQISYIKKFHISPSFTWGQVFIDQYDSDIRTATLEYLRNCKKVADRLEQVQVKLKSVIVPFSWYRSPAANNRGVIGKPNSYHLKGMAVDILAINPRIEAWKVHYILIPFWKGGLGRNYETYLVKYGMKGFTHLDIRNYDCVFDY